jgi:hypothetical protein
MPVRLVIVAASLLAAGAAVAEPMNAEAARRFVVGKTFVYSCFDGTRGSGRIFNDGSAIGTIQNGGTGATRMASLPAGTLRVKGDMVCATLRGMPIDPCFNLNKTDVNSFRGSITGLSFAYCDFTTRKGAPAARAASGLRPSVAPSQAEPPAAAPKTATPQPARSSQATPAQPPEKTGE